MTARRVRMLGRVAALMVRLRYIALIFGALAIGLFPASAGEVQPILYTALGIGLLYNTLLALALRHGPPESRPVQATASVIADIVLVTVIVWATGGVTSPFFGAFIGIGIVAAIYGGLRGAILGSILYIVCFAIASSLALGVIPWWLSVYVHFSLRISFAAAVSIFAGLLSRELETLASSNAELTRLNRLLHLRSTLSEIINATGDPTDLLLLVAKRLREEMAADTCLIFIERATARHLPLTAAVDGVVVAADPEELAGRYPSVVGALTERSPVTTHGADGRPGRALGLPLLSDDRVLGALYLADDSTTEPWDEDDVNELTGIASQLAIKLDNMRLLIDLNRSYVELRQVDHLKSAILANTSHELRTPLTLILGYAEALIGGLGGQLGKEQMTFAGGIRQSGKRLQGLVENLLSVASMEKGPITVQPRAIDLDRQIDHVVTSLQPAISGKGLTVVRPPAEGSRWLRADPQALRQVLTHLLKNAIQFSPPGAPVTIETAADDDPTLLQVRVTDAGVGMTSDQMASIFTMFHQVDGSSRRAHEGAGLGLYISKRLIEAHGGSIRVQSSPGQGSTFIFTIPRTTQVAAEAEAEEQRQAVAAGE